MWHSCESGTFFVLFITCKWWTELRAPEEPRGSGSPGKLRFVAFGVRLLLAAVYLTARYCAAQELINTALKCHFWKTLWKLTAQGLGAVLGGNALGPLWPHGPNPSIINHNLIFLNLFSLPFVEHLHCGFLEGFLLLLESRQKKLFTNQSGFHSVSQADEEEGLAVTHHELCPGSAALRCKPRPQPVLAELLRLPRHQHLW